MNIDLTEYELKLIYLAIVHEADKETNLSKDYDKLEEKIFKIRHLDNK